MRPHATDINALNLDTYGLSLITAKEDLLNDRISTDWAVFTYEKKWSLKLMDSGVGGLEELIKKLNKNLVLYGLCRVLDPNTQGPRFILIYWVGENVDATRKEISVQHLPAIRRFFKEASVMLRAHRIEDISPEAVTQALNRVPQPARSSHRSRLAGSHDLVGTNYTKTNPAIEMKFSMRDSFWQRNEREEERRKEHERLRLQEERISMEKARIERERLEEEERERRIQEKEIMVEEQRREQARLEVEQRRVEKARWAQQQKDFEEEMKGRFRRSQSIEMAAEAAALVSGRSLHPRDIFRQHERSVSCSNSPPSTPSSPRSSPSFSSRTTFRYQRSMTESILTPPSRSPSYFPGFQKRDSFSGPSFNTPTACSPAFIFSKAPLPGTSPKMDSLPSYIPPPISTKRGSPSHVKENISPQSSISPPQSSIVPPQGSMFPPQRTIPSPQSSISPSQSSISAPQSSISPPQSFMSPPQSFMSPPQSSISPPQSSISAPQSSISPPWSTIPPSQSSISPPWSTIPPSQSSIYPPRSTIPPPQSSISPPRSTIPPPHSSMPSHQRTISPLQSPQSPQPYLYDVPYRAEYVTLSTEESPQPNNTYSEKKGMNIKAQTRPPALSIPPPTNFDTPGATDMLTDVYRAEFVPVDSLNTSGNFVEQGHSPKSPRSFHTPEGPAAIKATVSISSPVSEIVFASVTPVTDAKISASPLSTEAPGLTPPLSAKAIGPAPHEVAPESVLASSTSAAITDQRRLPSPPVSVGNPPEAKPNFYPVSSYESSASSKPTTEGLLPSPLPESPITLEGQTSPVSSSLRSILQYVAPPPYTPFSARTTDSVTVRAPAFVKSLSTSPRFAPSNSARNFPEVLSTKAPNIETVTVNSNDQREPQIPPCVESQERTTSHLPDKPPQSQTVASNDVQAVDLAPASASLATISQPETQPIEYKAEFSPVDNLHREDSLSTSQMELNKDKPANLTLQVEFSSSNLPEVKTEPIFNQTEVSPADTFPVPQTEPIDTTCKIPPAQPVSIINLPEPQVEVVVPPTEVLPSSASLLTNILPEFQTKPSEKHTDVSPVEPLPVVASPLGNLPKSQDQLSEKQTEVSPVEPLPVVASLLGILPESQDQLSEKQAEVSPVEPLAVVASPLGNLPKSQDQLSEKQTEVSPLESLPVVASLLGILPESQDQLSKKQTEVSPLEPLPVVAFHSSIVPDPQDELREKQTAVPPVEPLPVVAFHSSVVHDPQDELSEKQTEVSAVEPLPVVASLSSIMPELCEKQSAVSPVEPLSAMASQADFQANLPILPTLPAYPPVTNLLENQGEPTEKQAEVQPTETFSASASLCSAIHFESQTEDIGHQTEDLPVETVAKDASSYSRSVPGCNQTELPLVEMIPIPEKLPTGGFSGSQLNNLLIDPPDFDTLPVSVTLPTERSPKSEPAEYQSEVPSVEAIRESLPTDNSLKFEEKLSVDQEQILEAQTLPVSPTLPKFQSEPSNIQSGVSAEAAIPISELLSMDRSPESQAELRSDQTEVPLIETLSASTFLPSDFSSGYQTDQIAAFVGIPPADLISVSPAIPQISSNELQEEPRIIQTEAPPSEPLPLPASFPLDGSLDSQEKPIKEQIMAPPIQRSPVTASLTANMSRDSSDEPINNQSGLPVSETLPVPASIPTGSLSEPQAGTYDGQPEILSDMVPSLQTLPVTAALCTKTSPEGQTEPKDDRSEVPQAQPPPEAAILLPDSSFRLEDEAYQSEVPVPLSLPVSLPIEFFSESCINQPENLAREDIPASFSLPVCDLPKPVEIRDIEIEFLPTEGKDEFASFTPFTRVISPEVQDEPSDRPSGNIAELAPLHAISQPDFFAATNEHPSEFPLIGFSPGLVSLCPDLLAEAGSILENSEVLKPDTFIASMVLCTDEPAELDIEEDYSQSSTEASFLPALLPSEFPAKPSQVPPADSTSLPLMDDSTSLTDAVYWARSVDPSLLSASFPTNISMGFAADPNGNLIEVESPPVCSSLLTDGSSEFLPPPPGPSCADDVGVLEALLFCDSLPATNLNLFEDPHPGSPPVTGSVVEPYHTVGTSGPETKAVAATENTADKVIVHDILPVNNLPVEGNQTPKDSPQCNSDLVNLSSGSAFVDQKHPTLIPTENALQTAENNIPDNNNTVPSQVVL